MPSDQRSNLPWMKFWVGDYLTQTQHLSTTGHGAFVLLIIAYWANQGPLPDDDAQLAQIAHMSTKEWKKLRPMLDKLFIVGDGVWHNSRLDETLAEAIALVQELSAAGRRGAAKRWGRGSKAGGPANDTANAESELHSEQDSDSGLQQEENSPSDVGGECDPEFDEAA